MDATRWQRLKQVFEIAVELEPVERAAYLQRECVEDDDLRSEVEEMLAADEDIGALVTPPSPHTVAELLGVDDQGPEAGTRIGAYVLRRRIAAGGMGTVHEASRADDFEQTVAIKLIRPGADGDELLRRFQAERQTLARLDHPGIARLVDGGATEDGQPYLVMEYIDGEPIDHYCDERRVGIEQRLRLFREVCAAVQDAHGKLVVHRDIKPANILIDGAGRPKLLDFGIAKLLEPDGVGSLEATRTDARPMTPLYASPEQVRGDPITTASDVYSLGVLLFELLTGRRPYRSSTQLAHELERAICEEEAQRPSTALGRRPAAASAQEEEQPWPSAAQLASQRSSEPARLRRQLSGDLDAIVLKAMRKEPELRYASADQLAEDVELFLAGKPVRARKDTWRYRSGKFLRRHRTAVLASSVLGLLLLASGVGLVWSSTLAADRATKVLQLMQVADLTDLEDYVAEVDRLWPATPQMAGAMRDWLAKSRSLGGQLDQHRQALERLRARALPYAEEDLEEDRARHPRLPELEDIRVRRAAELFRVEEGGPQLEERRERLAATEVELDALEGEVAARRSWRFADDRDRWQHDKLAELVAQLEDFVADQEGLIAMVEARLEFADSVLRLSIEEQREAWEEACAAIADPQRSPLYQGLELEPQLGLVPLGVDPESGLWEFGELQTGELPERRADGSLALGPDSGLVFVLVPGGSFDIGARPPTSPAESGAPNIDPFAIAGEGPVHEVQLEPYLLSKYEMTQGQWLRFSGQNPSQYLPGQIHGERPNDLDHPVESVSWFEAVEMLARLGLALPTEAQWEYAARAGSTTPWWTGLSVSSLQGAANLADRTALASGAAWPSLRAAEPELDDGYTAHAPVGTYAANRFGLHDVHGNVWEWTLDDYANYELPVLPGDGARLYKGAPRRVGRGGSYSDPPQSARSAHRGAAEPDYHDQNLGLRPARAIEP